MIFEVVMEKTFICTVDKPCCDLCGKKTAKPVYFRFEELAPQVFLHQGTSVRVREGSTHHNGCLRGLFFSAW